MGWGVSSLVWCWLFQNSSTLLLDGLSKGLFTATVNSGFWCKLISQNPVGQPKSLQFAFNLFCTQECIEEIAFTKQHTLIFWVMWFLGV